MWTNEREKLSFQFAKYGVVNTNIFDVASFNGRTYLFLEDNLLNFQEGTLQKLQMFNSFKCLAPSVFSVP